MKTNRFISCVIIGLCIFSIGCHQGKQYKPSYQKDKIYKVTILHTNDHHGNFWTNRKGEGGMAAQKTLVDKIRSEVKKAGGVLLVLSAGDINTGIPESDLQDAKPDIIAMNAIGYDAMAVGNHEFDNPLNIQRSQRALANFPFIAANIFDKRTQKPLFSSHKIFKFQELDIAVAGLLTEDTAIQGNPEILKRIAIKPAISTARNLIPKLKKKADMIIALTHMGYYKDGQHGGNAIGDVTLARSVDGIDVIVGGHTHEELHTADIQNNTIIVQAGQWGRYLGRLDLTFLNGSVYLEGYRLLPINLKKKIEKDGKTISVFIEPEIKQDQRLLAKMKRFNKAGSKQLEIKVGSVDGQLLGERKIIRSRETNLGNLITTAMLKKTGADVAIFNSGSIRASIDQGEITYKEILIVQPFSNTICMVTLNGSELKEYLTVITGKEPGTGAFAQLSGVEMLIKEDKIINVKIGGKSLSLKKTYKVAVPSYIAAGGDGYPKISDKPGFYDTGYIDADVTREFIKQNSPIKITKFSPSKKVQRQ